MALANYTSSASTPILRGTISRLAGALPAAYRRYAEYRRTVDALTAMSDRELDDLGLVRADIRDVARKAVF